MNSPLLARNLPILLDVTNKSHLIHITRHSLSERMHLYYAHFFRGISLSSVLVSFLLIVVVVVVAFFIKRLRYGVRTCIWNYKERGKSRSSNICIKKPWRKKVALYKLIPNECQRKTVNRQWSTLNVGTLSIGFSCGENKSPSDAHMMEKLWQKM